MTTLAATAPAATHAPTPSSWLEIASAVLSHTRTPLRARDIVEKAAELGLQPSSRSRTPAQSVNRDLHAAVRRGDARVRLGSEPGTFAAPGVRGAVRRQPAPTPSPRGQRAARPAPLRLPFAPLLSLVETHGGLAALGLSHREDDSAERTRHLERTMRVYWRSRKRGWIGLYEADRFAVQVLGLHPCMVWGQAWWDAGAAPAAAHTGGARAASA